MNERLLKKYLSLDADIKSLVLDLEKNPTIGTPLGANSYKIRLPISLKNKGKSGGAKIITYFITEDNELYLLSIYDKSEQSAISDKYIKSLINSILNQ